MPEKSKVAMSDAQSKSSEALYQLDGLEKTPSGLNVRTDREELPSVTTSVFHCLSCAALLVAEYVLWIQVCCSTSVD